MKRVAVNLACSLLTFTCGLAADELWNCNKHQVRTEQSKVEQLPINSGDFSASTNITFPTVTPNREVVLAKVISE